MRILERAQILHLGRIRSTNLAWFDGEFRLAQASAIEQVIDCHDVSSLLG